MQRNPQRMQHGWASLSSGVGGSTWQGLTPHEPAHIWGGVQVSGLTDQLINPIPWTMNTLTTVYTPVSADATSPGADTLTRLLLTRVQASVYKILPASVNHTLACCQYRWATQPCHPNLTFWRPNAASLAAPQMTNENFFPQLAAINSTIGDNEFQQVPSGVCTRVLWSC